MYLSLMQLTFVLGSTKTNPRNFVDLGRNLGSPFSLFSSLSRVKQQEWALLPLISLFVQLKLKLNGWPTLRHVSTIVRVRFWPKAIYSVSVHAQIISHELNPSHFPTFEIFVNNLVPRSHATPINPKNVKF